MLKKIALLIMLVLPMGVFAQSTLKFGHMTSTEIIPTMPEYTKALSELQALEKNYTERRQKELQDMAERQQQFQQEAEQGMQKAQQEKMTPIYKKLDDAIKAVGAAEGVIYIFDLARTPIPYVGAQSIDLTAKVKAQLGIK